jgi:hypothetical protein
MRDNLMRSPFTAAAINAAKTHCPQGHAYDAANTIFYIPANSTARTRLCRTCQNAHGQVAA